MKLLSLFSGIGAFEKALDRLEVPYELVGYCEIDKYASKSYSAIHGVEETMNLGDITKVDEKALPKNIDLVCYGFPCQDISICGKMRGLFNADGTQTRSGLFFEALRIIEETQPKVAIAENVKNLVGKKFKEQFKIVLDSLEQAGYNNYWKVLNAKDYGIPQNRERVFIVSIRKDIDTGCFRFPDGFPLELRLKDMLEDVVDEKYFITDYSSVVFANKNQLSLAGGKWDKLHENSRRAYSEEYVSPTLPTCQGGNIERKVFYYEPEIKKIDIPQTVKVRKYEVDKKKLVETLRDAKEWNHHTNYSISEALDIPVTKVEHWFRTDDCFAIPDAETWFQLKELLGIATDEFDESIMTFEEKEGVYEKSERHYYTDGIAPTLTSATAGNEKFITAVAMRGKYNEEGQIEQNIEISDREYANAITTVQKDSLVAEPIYLNSKGGRGGIAGLQPSLQDRVYDSNAISPAVTTAFMPSFTDNLRIRKLTPKECFRLMDFDDADFKKAEAVNSNTQLYKQAGNSIVVAVPYYIIKALIEANIFIEKEKKEMELKIYNPTEGGFIKAIEWNHEEIKKEVSEKVEYYKNLVYTDDQIKEAKADRATLNKFVKALDDKRKEIKSQCLAPYEAFERQMKEIIGIVNEPISLIDSQVKGYEERAKQEKEAKIHFMIDESIGEGSPLDFLEHKQIFDTKWLNASVSLKSIQEEVNARLEQVKKDLDMLSELPEFGFEAAEVYKSTLDVNKAVNEAKRMSDMAKAKAAHEAEMKARAEEQARMAAESEAKKPEPVTTNINDPQDIENAAPVKPAEVQKQWISFSALLSTEDALALKEFFNSRSIEFKSV